MPASITFSPISGQTSSFFQVSNFLVNSFSLIFFLTYAFVAFPASWCLDKKGLRFGVIVGAITTIIGVWIRALGNWGYAPCFIGQTIASFGQPFFLNALPKVAANWFPDTQRTIATTIASTSAPIGVAIGFLLSPAFVSVPSDIPMMLVYEAIIVTLLSVHVLYLLSDRPPTPPSACSFQPIPENYIKEIKKVSASKNFWLLCIVFCFSFGTFNAMATIIDQLLSPYGYSSSDSGDIGALVVVMGLIGCGVASVIVDKTRMYKSCIILCLLIATVSIVLFTIYLGPKSFSMIATWTSFIGFSMTPILPIVLELGVEISFPVQEATPSGILLIFGQLIAIIMTLVAGVFLQAGNVKQASWMFAAFIGVSFLFMIPFSGRRKRMETELAIGNESQNLPVLTGI